MLGGNFEGGMTAPAWMPLYVADYLADTGHLSEAAEHGAYLLLIMHYWRHGSLPQEEALLARIAKTSPEDWPAVRELVRPFFQDGWRHKRIDAELAKVADISDKRRAAVNKRYYKSTTIVAGLNTQSQSPSDIKKERICRVEADPTLPPEEKLKNRKAKYPPEFDSFWLSYPRTPIMSKQEAFRAWGRLPPDDRRTAADAVAHFRAFLASKPDHPAVHACRFLSQRRFEGFTSAALPGNVRSLDEVRAMLQSEQGATYGPSRAKA